MKTIDGHQVKFTKDHDSVGPSYVLWVDGEKVGLIQRHGNLPSMQGWYVFPFAWAFAYSTDSLHRNSTYTLKAQTRDLAVRNYLQEIS